MSAIENNMRGISRRKMLSTSFSVLTGASFFGMTDLISDLSSVSDREERASAENDADSKLSIAYVNDVHGYLEAHNELFYKGNEEIIQTVGGYARIAGMIRKIRERDPNTLFFDGGDTFHGTLPLVQSKGEVLTPILNKLDLSAMVAHWDFAYGPGQLKNLASRLNYPILGINVFNSDNSLFFSPYLIKRLGNLKIGIIGICSDITDKTMPKEYSRGLKFTNGMKELPEAVKKVKSEGADVIVLLSHLGFPQDAKLVSEVKGIDICLSAHTHNRLYQPVKTGGTMIIQCGNHGSFIGHLELHLKKKKIVDSKYELITVEDTVEEDSAVKKMVDDIMAPYRAIQKEVVGNTTNILHRYNTLESSMDNLLLSAIKDRTGAEMAFSNGWRYGAPIPAGPVTKWDLYNLIPMDPPVSTVVLTGAEILNMLEENLERTFSGEPMKQMGGYLKRCLGISVKMRVENPGGHRIQQLFAGDKPLESGQTYLAAFVTEQGIPEGIGKERKDLGENAVDVITRFLKKNPGYSGSLLQTFTLV